MVEIHWTSLPLHRSSHRTRDYLLLLGRVKALLDSDQDPGAPPLLGSSLDLLDQLASFLNTPLLPGDSFALESELVHLSFYPITAADCQELVAATRTHLHLLRHHAHQDGPGHLEGWTTLLKGIPLGVSLQPVGYLGAHEVVVLSRDGDQLRELRLALSGANQVAVIHGQQEESSVLVALGGSGPDSTAPLQIDVRRDPGQAGRPRYQLRIRSHAAETWRVVHVAHHPLQNPLFDGSTLFFTARSSQIMALDTLLETSVPPPRTVVTLETPSPIQKLLRFTSAEGPTLLAATADGTLFAIDPEGGRLRWKFDTGHSLTAAAFQAATPDPTLIIGTPDGLLELFHPVDTLYISRLITDLLARTHQSLEGLLDASMMRSTPPPASPPAETDPLPGAPDRPFLRLLALDRLLQARHPGVAHLARIKAGLLQAFFAAERGGRVSPSEIIRFLSYQFMRFAGDAAASQQKQPEGIDGKYLAMLFSVLDALAPRAHADARRRLERLLRRLRDELLGAERYEYYRSQYAPSLTLRQLSTFSLRHTALSQIKAAEDTRSPELKKAHLLRALGASWRRYLTPLNRSTSFQGLAQAVRVSAGPPTPDAPVPPGPQDIRLVGLARDGLQLFKLNAQLEMPEAAAFYPLAGAVRLAAGPLFETHADVVIAARPDRISSLAFKLEDGNGTLVALPVEDLEIDEPVTALEMVQLPNDDPRRPFASALAIGQADGRFRLCLLAPIDTLDDAHSSPRYRWVPVLDLHRTSAVHHVAVYRWPERDALLISADHLHVFHDAHLEGTTFKGMLETIELESAVTAFTVAVPPPRKGPATRPVLVVGLANGLVQAFQPAPLPDQRLELCWLYRAPQVITNLAYLPDPNRGWFVAAADDGALHLLRYGEPHHRVAVERYPFDLTPLLLPGSTRPHLLVSSPARAVSLLEVTGTSAKQELEQQLDRLAELIPRHDLPVVLEQTNDPTLLALAVYILGDGPLPPLLAFADRHRRPAVRDETLGTTLLSTLMARAPDEAEARAYAFDYLKEVLADPEGPTPVKVHLLLTLGSTLERVDELELAPLLAPLNLDEPAIARAYLEMLEHLWGRFRDEVNDLVWWRGLNRLGMDQERFDRRRLLPIIGTLARKLLNLNRTNVLDQIRYLRELEESGIYLARLVCDALSRPFVLGDEVVHRVVSQYGRMLRAQGPHKLYEELRARRDLLLELQEALPQATAALPVYEDILETFEYNEYDQYSRFLVDAHEFMPRARDARADNASIFDAFAEVRARLTAVVPPPSSDRDAATQFQDRVQALLAQAEVLLDVVRLWSSGATLEQQIVAAILSRWRERILLPEIRRLQESVELVVKELRVVLPEEGGLAEVVARIHNLGGRQLEGLRVGLAPSLRDPYLWEGGPEWCQGPIHYGQALEYRTEILVEDKVDDLTLAFDLVYLEQGHEMHRVATATTRIEREESPDDHRRADQWRQELPATFDALRQTLVRADAGRLLMVVAEEVREREQLVSDLAAALSEGDSSRRAVVLLDLPAMLEGPPRALTDDLPAWWIPDRLARALVERGLLSSLPERVELRADPRASLNRMVDGVLEGVGELWLVMRRASRAFVAHTQATVETAREWLHAVVDHPSRRVRVLMPGDFTLAARLNLPPSPLARKVELLDVDRPYPPDGPRSREEHLSRIHRLLAAARLFPSDVVRNKLIAHTGGSLPLMRRIISRLEPIRAEAWLQWQRRDKEAQGEPEDLEHFLNQALPAISRPLKERLRVLPFFHRLALAAVASGRVAIGRRELREGMQLARPLYTTVRSRYNRPKRLYTEHAVLLEGDVTYLQTTVGELQGQLEIGMFRALDFSISLSHLLAVVGMPRLLADLEALGLIRHHSSSAGPLYGFISPLLRRWLVTAHPFENGEEANLRRRLSDDGNVAETIPLATLVELNGRLGSTGQLSDFLVFLGLLEQEGKKSGAETEAASRQWDRLLNLARRMVGWRNRASTDAFRIPLQEWAAMFTGKVEATQFELEEGIYAVSIDLTALRIPRLSRAVVFGLSRALTPLRAERLREIVRRVAVSDDSAAGDLPAGAMGFTLLPVLGPGELGTPSPINPPVISDAHRELLGERLLPLTERDLVATALSDDGRRAFLDLLARGGFRFQHLSPYQPLGPLKGRAMDVLFVGREEEIDDVLRHPDQQFAIVGSRKIGKTSLLLKLKQELLYHLGEKAKVLYLDCATLTPSQVWRSIAEGLGLAPAAGDHGLELRRQLEAARSPAVLLLDEIDGVYDAGGHDPERAAEQLMWDLRSLAAAGVLRLIMAGYVRLYERRLDPHSAFHNFTTFRKLSALTPEAARALVRGPMGALDIELASEGLIDLVLDRTYRVPWIIQLFCNQLITRLDDRLARLHRFDRRILREDVDGVSVQIEEELYTHFTSPRVMSTTEQLLLLTMVEAGVSSFGEDDLRDRLEAHFGEQVWNTVGYEDLARSLDNLTLTLALTVEGGVYSFPLDMYPTVIRSRLGDVRPRLDRLYQKLARDGTF